jgi:hypothetical protein
LKADVKYFIKQCSICQQAKAERIHPPGFLQPLPIPQGVWQDLTMDFIKGLPNANQKGMILLWLWWIGFLNLHIFPLKHPFTAAKVAQMFLDNVVKLHGTPRSVVSDRDKVFTSNFWKALFSALNTKLALTTAYHPQSDGQSERVNQSLEIYLRCAISDSPTQWKKWLPLAEFWYNSSYHTALKCSPFKALYGYEPVFAVAPVMAKTGDQLVEGLLAERKAHSEILKQKLASAQNQMKMQADKNRTDMEFMVGEFVLVKLQPYVQSTVVSRPCPKLALKYFGPFKILQKIGLVAYKLELPSSSQIHMPIPCLSL